MLFFKNKPDTPPSAAALAVEEEAKEGEFLPSIKELLKNKNLLILMLAFGCILSSFSVLAAVIG